MGEPAKLQGKANTRLICRYRKIRPELTLKKGRQRNNSPPCPHEWESHEDIAKMQEMLRKPKAHRQGVHVTSSLEPEIHSETMKMGGQEEENRRREEEKIRLAEKQKDEADCIALRLIAEQMASESNLSNSGKKTETNSSKMQSLLSFRTESSVLQNTPKMEVTSMSQQTISSVSNKATLSQEDVGSSKEETDSSSTGEEIFYEATATASRHVREEPPPPLPPKARVSGLSPSPSSCQSQPSPSFSDDTSQSTVRTGQYIRVREKVVQLERKLEEDALKLEEEEEGGTPRTGVRPENLVGAVRLLPTPTPPNSRPASQVALHNTIFLCYLGFEIFR